jgi:hypothetical protein
MELRHTFYNVGHFSNTSLNSHSSKKCLQQALYDIITNPETEVIIIRLKISNPKPSTNFKHIWYIEGYKAYINLSNLTLIRMRIT